VFVIKSFAVKPTMEQKWRYHSSKTSSNSATKRVVKAISVI